MKIEIEIPTKNIINMLDSASRWYRHWAHTEQPLVDAIWRPIVVTVSDDGDPIECTIYPSTLKEGIVLCARESPRVFEMLLENKCDGPASDVIVQYAIFGRVRFG